MQITASHFWYSRQKKKRQPEKQQRRRQQKKQLHRQKRAMMQKRVHHRMKTHPKIMLRILSAKTYQRILLMRNVQKKQTVATIPKMQIPVLIQKQPLRNRHLLRVLIPARGNTLETLH